MEDRVAHAVGAQDSQRVKSLCAFADDAPDMVGRRQAIGHRYAEDLERRVTNDTGQWRWWYKLTLALVVDYDHFLCFRSVQRQVVIPCPRLDVVELGRPRVDVVCRDYKVGVVSELDEVVAGSHGLQVACIDHICRRSDA